MMHPRSELLYGRDEYPYLARSLATIAKANPREAAHWLSETPPEPRARRAVRTFVLTMLGGAMAWACVIVWWAVKR